MAQAIAHDDARPRRARRRARHAAAPCPDCNDTGSVWIVCPDAGAAKVACTCKHRSRRKASSIALDLALAVAFVSGCGLLFFAL